MLEAQDVRVSFGSRIVLDHVAMHVNPGEMVGLTAPSGSGKTTLLRALAGLQHLDAGTVYCDGDQVLDPFTRRGAPTRGRIAMVYQSPRQSCDPLMTLREIIKETSAPDTDLSSIIERVHLPKDLLDRRPPQVSDGQLQRAALARAFATSARYILCDEITAMLDPGITASIARTVNESVQDGIGVLFASHDTELLSSVCSRLEKLQ